MCIYIVLVCIRLWIRGCLLSGISVCCTRQEGSSQICTGYCSKVARVLQRILWHSLPPKQIRWVHPYTIAVACFSRRDHYNAHYPHVSAVFVIMWPAFYSDMVAIPDFLAGAMENWGLITFRETTLLVGDHSSPLDKQLVTSVIAHELAHQVLHWETLTRETSHLSINDDALQQRQLFSLCVVS